jgi:hypothetical protein
MFRQLTESTEGLRMLKALAEEGMRGWDCPDVYLDCLDTAFRDISFRALAIAALEDFADTSPRALHAPGATAPSTRRRYPPPAGKSEAGTGRTVAA